MGSECGDAISLFGFVAKYNIHLTAVGFVYSYIDTANKGFKLGARAIFSFNVD